MKATLIPFLFISTTWIFIMATSGDITRTTGEVPCPSYTDNQGNAWKIIDLQKLVGRTTRTSLPDNTEDIASVFFSSYIYLIIFLEIMKCSFYLPEFTHIHHSIFITWPHVNYSLSMKSWTIWPLPTDFPLNRHFACGIRCALQANTTHTLARDTKYNILAWIPHSKWWLSVKGLVSVGKGHVLVHDFLDNE